MHGRYMSISEKGSSKMGLKSSLRVAVVTTLAVTWCAVVWVGLFYLVIPSIFPCK